MALGLHSVGLITERPFASEIWGAYCWAGLFLDGHRNFTVYLGTTTYKLHTCPAIAVNKSKTSEVRKASLLFSPVIQYTMVKNRVG